MVRQIVGLGVGSVMGISMIGSIPNISGSSAVTTIKAKSVEGIGEVGQKLPILGKIKGTSMVFKSTKELTTAHKKLFGKKKRRYII